MNFLSKARLTLALAILCHLSTLKAQTFMKTFGGSGYEEAWSMTVAPNGDFIMVGQTNSFGAGSDDAYVIRTDGSGNEIWSKTFGGSHIDWGCSVEILGSEIIVGGTTRTFGPGMDNQYHLRLDQNGNLLGSNSYGGGGAEYTRVLKIDDNGDIVSTGYTNYIGNNDFNLLKTDAMGNLIFSKAYGNWAHDFSHHIEIGHGGDIC